MLPESLAWLDAKFVQDVLRSSENDDSIEVKDAVMRYASAVGDNYAGEIIRASVEYSRKNSLPKATEKKSLIIKVAPSTGDAKLIMTELEVYRTEIRMMDQTLVKMNEMLVEEGCRLSAKVLYAKIGDPTFIVLEDLTAIGYKLADRLAGLDLEHCMLVMRALGRFHATSVALREKDPEAMVDYKINALHTDMTQIVHMCKNAFSTVSKELIKWPELGSSRSSYSEKFSKLADRYREIYIECTTPKPDEFTVLNHGDCWVNNMLFKYNDEGKVVDHIFVDFQTSNLSSPATDILYFFHTSLSDDVELRHRDALLEEYLKVLTKTMARLKCSAKAPDMTELKKILKKYEFLAVMAACLTLPFVLAEKKDAKTLNEIFEAGDDFVGAGYRSPTYIRKMTRWIPKWNASGVLDS